MGELAANNSHGLQPLVSIESFSHSWLLNQTPENSSFRSCSPLDFIEMDPRLPASRRFFVRAGSHDFNFSTTVDPPSIISDSDPVLLHADQLIISDRGFLMPDLFLNPLNQETDSIISMPASCDIHDHVVKPEIRNCRSSNSKRYLFFKYFGRFLMPFCKRICKRSSSRVEAVYSCDNRRRSSCDSESSIHEAVLHCKRSCITGTPNYERQAG